MYNKFHFEFLTQFPFMYLLVRSYRMDATTPFYVLTMLPPCNDSLQGATVMQQSIHP